LHFPKDRFPWQRLPSFNEEMIMKNLLSPRVALMGFLFAFVLSATAAKNQAEIPLNTRGTVLLEQYTKQLETLRAEAVAALPAVDEGKQARFLEVRAKWTGLTNADDAISPAERKARDELREKTQRETLDAAGALLADLAPVLSSNGLDPKLMRISILTDATPRGLAEFAQQGAEEEKVLDSLLADDALMKEILEAGGANGGEYGEAMQVYSAILKASERAREKGSIFQRLALGTSLQMPWLPGKDKGGVHGIVHTAPTNIDQVQRYLHYEKAYLDGELDPAFKDMNTWECRFITIDGHSNEDHAWVRAMMRTYRPDQITNPDYKWRYVRIVKDDLPYCSTTHDPSLGSVAQQELALGGVCGRRAFFGRLAARAFGIPARASTQTGHAALSHWTPDGWTICFGAWWSVAWCGPQGGLDFLLESQAREFPQEYIKVLRAQWIGDACGEEGVSIRHYGQGGGFWDGLAFCKKQAVVEDAKIKALELTGGMKLGESDDLLGDETGGEVEIPEEDRQLVVGGDGVITIPGLACYSPRKTTERVVFMKSNDKGSQLHYSRLGKLPELVKYRVEVPAAGAYELSALVAIVSNKQELLVRVNRDDPAPFGLPYTKGMWMTTEPLKVALDEGRNTISITARAPNRGVSIKQFQLKPVK
jgi:hypothetical protein